MAAQILPIESVVSDPEVRSGSPLVAGTTLRVSDLAEYHTLAGLTPDELSAQFCGADRGPRDGSESRPGADPSSCWAPGPPASRVAGQRTAAVMAPNAHAPMAMALRACR